MFIIAHLKEYQMRGSDESKKGSSLSTSEVIFQISKFDLEILGRVEAE